MRIKTIEISGFSSALQALRLPFSKEPRSYAHAGYDVVDNNFKSSSICEIEEKDMKLMSTLVKRGDEHAKVLRGIIVYAEIEAPVYFFCEEETYRIGHERLSSESTMHLDCKGLTGEELVKEKSEIPMGKVLKKIDFFSYQCLRNIYFQRRDHRLPEWKMFCDWIESLPYANLLITIEKENQIQKDFSNPFSDMLDGNTGAVQTYADPYPGGEIIPIKEEDYGKESNSGKDEH